MLWTFPSIPENIPTHIVTSESKQLQTIPAF